MYTPLNTVLPLFRGYIHNMQPEHVQLKPTWPNNWPLWRMFFNYKYGKTDSTVMQARLCFGVWPQCCAAHMISAPGVHSMESYQRQHGQFSNGLRAKDLPHIEDFIKDKKATRWTSASAEAFGYDMLAQALAAVVIRSGHSVFATDNNHGKILKLVRRIEEYQGTGTESMPYCRNYVSDEVLTPRLTKVAQNTYGASRTSYQPWADAMYDGGMVTSGRITITKNKAFSSRNEMTLYGFKFQQSGAKGGIKPTKVAANKLAKIMLSKEYTETAPASTWGHA